MTENDDLTVAQPEDFFVTRDGDDELQPITQALPGVEQAINVVPMTMGDINKYGSAEGRLNPAELSDEELATILNTHWYDVRDQDDYEITPEMVAEDMIGFGRDALITAILRASGYDMTQALNMENLELLEKIDDPGKLETMMEFAQDQN